MRVYLRGVHVVVVGGPSGSGLAVPDGLVRLAAELGISDRVTFLPPQSRDNLATVFRAVLDGRPSAGQRGAGLVDDDVEDPGTALLAQRAGSQPAGADQGVRGADARVPGEGQLGERGEDPDPVIGPGLGGRAQERRLREVELEGQRLALLGGEMKTPGVEDVSSAPGVVFFIRGLADAIRLVP